MGQVAGWGRRQATSQRGQLFPLQMKTGSAAEDWPVGGATCEETEGKRVTVTKSGPVLPPSTPPTGSSLSHQAPGLDASCQNTQTNHMAMEPVPSHSQRAPPSTPRPARLLPR